MESIMQVGEMMVGLIVAGLFDLAPGVIVWLAVTTMVIAIQQLERVGFSPSGHGEEEMLLT